MPEYTLIAVASVMAVVALELRVWRTGMFGERSYWITLGICLFFMVWVNGWLTKLSAPVVLYDGEQRTGLRFPWDIPVEDYLFGFSMLTLVLVLWERAGRGDRAASRPKSDRSVP